MDEDVIYPSVDDILLIHSLISEIPVEQAANRLIRPEVVESALARPIHRATYTGCDLIEQAACLAHAIAESQTFVDGNKRTAFIAFQSFLGFNGYTLTCSDDQLAQWIIDLSSGFTIEDFAERIRPCVVAAKE